MHIKWLGAAGIELNINNKIILIDPYLTRISLLQFFFKKIQSNHKIIKDKVKSCDYLFITHSHYDHIMDAADIINNTKCKTFGSNNSCEILKRFNINEKNLTLINYGDQITIDNTTVKIFKSKHLDFPGMNPKKITRKYKKPLKAKDYYMDSSFSFLFTINMKNEKLKILLSNNKIEENIPQCDILITAPFFEKKYFRNIISKSKLKIIIPNHWDYHFKTFDNKIKENYMIIHYNFPFIKKINLNKFNEMINKISNNVKVFKLDIFKAYNIKNILEDNK